MNFEYFHYGFGVYQGIQLFVTGIYLTSKQQRHEITNGLKSVTRQNYNINNISNNWAIFNLSTGICNDITSLASVVVLSSKTVHKSII